MPHSYEKENKDVPFVRYSIAKFVLRVTVHVSHRGTHLND